MLVNSVPLILQNLCAVGSPVVFLDTSLALAGHFLFCDRVVNTTNGGDLIADGLMGRPYNPAWQ
jgi:hypothetical protein